NLSTGSLTLGVATSGIGFYNLSDLATFQGTGNVTIGSAGTGIIQQTGGTFSAQQNLFLSIVNSASSTGLYSLSGGLLSVSNTLSIGFNGTMNHSGGNAILNALGIDSTHSSTYNLSGS